jgi:hypothetical protein
MNVHQSRRSQFLYAIFCFEKKGREKCRDVFLCFFPPTLPPMEMYYFEKNQITTSFSLMDSRFLSSVDICSSINSLHNLFF